MPTLAPTMNTMELLHYKPMRCAWCGEIADRITRVSPRMYASINPGPTALCALCVQLEDNMQRLELVVARTEYLLKLSPNPPVGEVTEHRTAAWRGRGEVIATDGALTQVAWPSGSVLWHLTSDLHRTHITHP